MRGFLLIIPLLISVASSGLFNNICKALFNSDKPAITKLIEAVPKALLDELENDEQQGAQFICEILAGDFPGAFENLAEGLATEVLDDIEEGIDDITSFVKALPTLAPEILDYIISEGEDVVEVVDELFNNPAGVVTLIVDDIQTVISDIESVATDIWHGFTCLFKPVEDCSTSTIDPAATLSSSCDVIQAAATTTWNPVMSSTSYTPAQPTATASSSVAVQTSTTEQAAQSKSQEVEPAGTTNLLPVQATNINEGVQSTSQGSGDESGGAIVQVTAGGDGGADQGPSNGGGRGNAVDSGGGSGFILQVWIGILACLVGLVVVL